ncbi:MAG TPA: hypothetical protein VJ907_08690 [Halanaerobiales bacterium]|nr:hypothetical protein [Halanaerobiales bacterium]
MAQTTDVSIEVIKYTVKIGGLVTLVIVFFYFDGPKFCGKILGYFRPSAVVAISPDSPEDGIFSTVINLKDKVDNVDYEKLLNDLNSWNGTLKKFLRLAKFPISVVTTVFSSFSYFKKNDNDDDNEIINGILNGDHIGQEDLSLPKVIIEESKLKLQDDDFDLDIGDISDIMEDFQDS